MKAVVVLFAFAVAAASASQMILNDAAIEKVKGIAKGCQEKLHIDQDTIKKIRSNDIVETDNAKNYFHCIFTDMNWVNGASMDEEGLKKDLKSDLAFDVITPCSRFRSTGPQLSYNIYKCITEHVEGDYQAHL